MNRPAVNEGWDLARFRADPEKVRVGVRRNGQWWQVTLSSKVTGAPWVVTFDASSPKKALTKALRLVERYPGVDLGMQWAYLHPFATMRSQDK